jgi:hypothetical protein
VKTGESQFEARLGQKIVIKTLYDIKEASCFILEIPPTQVVDISGL